VRAIAPSPTGFRLQTGRGPVDVEWIVNAAGLFADEVAAMVGLVRPIRACRGDYFRLRSTARYRHLIYPVKAPNDPGLGVHLTIELDGAYRMGPDWTWVDDKDDYAPAPEKHAAFLEATRRLLGAVDPDRLTYDGCGLRPKLVGPGEPAADFEIDRAPERCIHLLGIESPGLTAALALADEVGEMIPRG
jgi:L-2-hydroxyglutarate oxidase LhgO